MRSEKDFLVGWTRTVDGGKSFHPFINMKDWTELISKKLGESPSQIQLLQFYPHQRNQIRVEVETGKKKLLLEGTITNQALTAEKWFIVN